MSPFDIQKYTFKRTINSKKYRYNLFSYSDPMRTAYNVTARRLLFIFGVWS